jgi:hypothetical protein
MKNKILIVAALTIILFAGNIFSQVEVKPTLGLNFTNFSKDPVSGKNSAKVGWQLGASIAFGSKFYGEGGIFWVYKSNEFTEDATDNKLNRELSGIQIPVLVGFHLMGDEAGSAGLRAFGGLSTFILTKVNALDLTKDDFTTASHGIFLGAGLDIAIFFLDLKYEWSLSDVTSITSYDLGKSKSLFINAGIRLKL